MRKVFLSCVLGAVMLLGAASPALSKGSGGGSRGWKTKAGGHVGGRKKGTAPKTVKSGTPRAPATVRVGAAPRKPVVPKTVKKAK